MSAPACTNSQLDELEGPKVKITLPASGFYDVVLLSFVITKEVILHFCLNNYYVLLHNVSYYTILCYVIYYFNKYKF